MRADPELRERIVAEFEARAVDAGCTTARFTGTTTLEDLVPAGWPDPHISRGGARFAGLDESSSPSVAAELGAEGPDGVSVALVGAVAGVAETGSVLVTHDDVEELWLIGLSEMLVVAVSADEIFATLETAGPVLEDLAAAGRSWTLLTGPSRTADIERILTIGVQGSFAMHVVVCP